MIRGIESPMIKVITVILILFAATAITIPTVESQSEKLVILMPTPSKYVDPYIESFREWYQTETGKTIEVEHVRLGGVKTVDRVEEQGGTPYEDVVVSLGFDEFERFKAGGYLSPYFSANREYIPDTVGNLVGKDLEGYYTGFSLAAYGIMVNTEVIQNENLSTPTGYRDLALNKDYYGLVAMGSPLSTSIAHGNVEVILAHYGWVDGWNVSIHLASLVDKFFMSTGTATSLTAEGEYAAVLTKNTYWNEYVSEQTFAEYPVEWVWPEEGTAAYILYAGILRGAENRENAELWIDWMLSEEGQRAWLEYRHETVLRSDIEFPAGIPSIEELDLGARIDPKYDSTVVEQQYDAVTTLWSEKLIGHHSLIQKNYGNEDMLDSLLDSWILHPLQAAEEALSEAQGDIQTAISTTLTESGDVLLEQAEIKFNEAQTSFFVTFDYEKTVEHANEASSLAQIALGYIPPPPVWPYYLGMVIVAVIAGSVSGKLGYDYFKKRYQESIDEIFSKLKDKLEVDDSGRLLLVSDVMRVPMILTTRDHIAQIQKTCEEVLGKEKMIEVMYQSGFDSGYDFSIALASMSELSGVQILEEYLRIASVRGWGRFIVEKADLESGEFILQLKSSLVEEFPPGSGKVCHIWRGIFAGVVQAVLESLDKTGVLESEETMCIADGDPECEIRVKVDF